MQLPAYTGAPKYRKNIFALMKPMPILYLLNQCQSSIAPQRRHSSGADTLRPARPSRADQLVGRGRRAERERLGKAQRRCVPLALARLPAQAASLALLGLTACSPRACTSPTCTAMRLLLYTRRCVPYT